MGDEEPSDLCVGGALVVLGQTTASSEPGEGSFDDPSPRQKLETFDAVRSFHDLDGPRTAMGDRVHELAAAIDAVGKNMAHAGEGVSQPLQQRHCAMAILDVCRMN